MLCAFLALATVEPGPALIKLDPVPFTQVTIKDRFWAPRRETNRKVSLTHALDMLGKSGTIDNFDLVTEGKHTGFKGYVFQDSDLYKTLEAVSYSLATDPDPVLEKRVDGMIAKIAAAQMPDGYVDTYYEVNEPGKRLTNLAWNHELYCAGHMFEAAVAHYQATKKKTFLNIATKYADFLAKTFGDGPGQRAGYCGHPEIELALVKLSRATGNKEYFRLATFFINHRGEHFFAKEQHIPEDKYDGDYYQDNVPIRDQKTIVGHAVRAGYLMSGVVDVARDTNDNALLAMVDRVWNDTTKKKMYLTGGIGPSASNEGFTVDYDLPNLTAYQETCASVAMAMWNHRLAMLYANSKYADVLETALYNGVLAGYSMDGKRYFYVNPLASMGNHHRSEWFGCACCPPNEARTLAQLGGYAYATSPNALWVNLYIQGSVDCNVAGDKLHADIVTDYPWNGSVRMTVKPAKPATFNVNLRIPGWSPTPTVLVNSKIVYSPKSDGVGYFTISREWKPGDTIEFNMPMNPRRVAANPMVKDDQGKLALARGPIVYCLEQVDNATPLNQISVPPDAQWQGLNSPNELNGIVAMNTKGIAADTSNWAGGLYATAPEVKRVKVRAIPYYAWDNRAAGPMEVWIPTTPPPAPVGGLERQAKVSISFVSSNAQPWGVNDGVEPKSSGEQPAALAHWWNHKGGTEWIQYDWIKPRSVSKVQVYWFDDTGRGECRLPSAWHLEAMVDGDWKPVKAEYPVKLDSWCDVTFDPLTTNSLRLVVEMKKGWSAGIHEWKVWGPEE